MDLLEQYIKENSLTVERILEEVDEWTLYCYYLDIPDLTTRKTYPSPIRSKDEHPSFSIYESSKSSDVEFLWKDSALGESGDIFKLLILTREGINNKQDALKLIASDFEIGNNHSVESKKIIKINRPNKEATRIRIKAKSTFSKEGLEFWKSFYVNEELLAWKQVQEVEYVWYNDSQQYPYRTSTLTFAYPEYNLESKEWCYQLYMPFEKKEFKFRNDLDDNQIYGWNHISKAGSLLVITKSNKDILCLKKFGVESVSPRSETTLIKPKTVELLKQRFNRVVTLFDNDEAGILGSSKYELEHIFIPIDSKCKDFSDYLKAYGIDRSQELLNKLLYGLD